MKVKLNVLKHIFITSTLKLFYNNNLLSSKNNKNMELTISLQWHGTKIVIFDKMSTKTISGTIPCSLLKEFLTSKV